MYNRTQNRNLGIGGWFSMSACLLVCFLCIYALISSAFSQEGRRSPLAGSESRNIEELGDILKEAGITTTQLRR